MCHVENHMHPRNIEYHKRVEIRRILLPRFHVHEHAATSLRPAFIQVVNCHVEGKYVATRGYKNAERQSVLWFTL